MAKQLIDAPRSSIFKLSPEQAIIIGRDTDHGPEHPRYDRRALNDFDEDIVQVIMKRGVRLPVEVYLTEAGDLEVVDGRQRVINAREASRRLVEAGMPPLSIPCMRPVRGAAGDGVSAELQVILNEHRQEDTPMGRALKAYSLTSMGYEPAQLAPLFRVSIETVRNYLSLIDLIPGLQDLVESGKLKVARAYRIARKSKQAQEDILKQIQEGKAPQASKPKAPGRSKLRKIVEASDGAGLPADFVLGLRYALGQADDLPEGIATAIRELEG